MSRRDNHHPAATANHHPDRRAPPIQIVAQYIERMWADTAYRALNDWLRRALGWQLSIPQHWWSGGIWMRADAEPPTRPSGFQVLARRWVVERIPAWLTTNWRLAKDYERLVETGEMLLYLAVSRILLRRLTRKERQLLISLVANA